MGDRATDATTTNSAGFTKQLVDKLYVVSEEGDPETKVVRVDEHKPTPSGSRQTRLRADHSLSSDG